MSFQSKTKMSKCYYCGEMMRDENLKSHCKNIHNAAKHVAGERSVEGFFNPPVSKVLKASLQSSSSTSEECLLASGGQNTHVDLLLQVQVQQNSMRSHLKKTKMSLMIGL